MRDRRAWHAEQRRVQRERRAYWLGIGEVYLFLVVLVHLGLGITILLAPHA